MPHVIDEIERRIMQLQTERVSVAPRVGPDVSGAPLAFDAAGLATLARWMAGMLLAAGAARFLARRIGAVLPGGRPRPAA
jgi:hypothetical protein